MEEFDADDPETGLSKHDRLVNAWRAAGRDANVETVASLTGASQSYASQVRQALESGDLSDGEVDAATDPALVERYEEQLRMASADGGDPAENGGEGQGTRQAGHQTGRQRSQPSAGEQAGPQGQPRTTDQGTAPPRQPPRPPRQPPQAQPPRQQPQQDRRESIQAEDGLYVPTSALQEIDETLAVLAEEAQFEVENVPPQQPQHQAALARLYVARRARSLLGDAADEAVPADEV